MKKPTVAELIASAQVMKSQISKLESEVYAVRREKSDIEKELNGLKYTQMRMNELKRELSEAHAMLSAFAVAKYEATAQTCFEPSYPLPIRIALLASQVRP